MTAYIVANKAHSLKAGQKVKLSLDGASKNRTRNGTIEFVSPVVDKSSLLRTVKIIFDNSDRSVEPGVTGKLYLK
jgi:multidrug efflux pump subunit AcrA (membrane-fusion protein)